MNSRPKSLSVCGILNIIFGLFGLFGLLTNFVMSASSMGQSNPAISTMMKFPEVMTYQKIVFIPGCLMAVLAIVAGAQLMKAREWARKASIAYGIWMLLSLVGGVWVSRKIMPAVLDAVAATSNMPAEAASMAKAMTSIGMYLAPILGAIYPICLLVLMTRAKVKAACSGIALAPPPIPQA